MSHRRCELDRPCQQWTVNILHSLFLRSSAVIKAYSLKLNYPNCAVKVTIPIYVDWQVKSDPIVTHSYISSAIQYFRTHHVSKLHNIVPNTIDIDLLPSFAVDLFESWSRLSTIRFLYTKYLINSFFSQLDDRVSKSLCLLSIL